MDDDKRRQLKELYERRRVIEAQTSALWSKFNALREEALEPMQAGAEALDAEMNTLLGETYSWMEGDFDEAGLPVVFKS
jgi:hypothetical protein